MMTIPKESKEILLEYLEAIKMGIEMDKYHAASLLIKALDRGLDNIRENEKTA